MSSRSPALNALSINGRHVIPAAEAARRTGWSRNYIGKLCRSGDLAGVRTVSGWFVEEASLEQFQRVHAERKRDRAEILRAERRNEYVRNRSAPTV